MRFLPLVAVVLICVLVDLSYPYPEWRAAASYFTGDPVLTIETAGPPEPVPLWLLVGELALVALLGWATVVDHRGSRKLNDR